MKEITRYTALNSIHIDNLITERVCIEKNMELTLTQKKTILLLASLLTSDDSEIEEVSITFAEYFRVMQMDYSSKYKELLEKSILNFCSKCFYIETKNNEKCLKKEVFRWIDKAYINYKDSTVHLKLSDDLKPYFLNLSDKARTIFQLGYTLNFSCKYSIDVYMFASRCKNMNVPYLLKIEDAAKRFGDGKYKDYANLMRRVIEPAVKEINEKSDLKVTVRAIRKKNKTTHIAFLVLKKFGAELEKANEWKHTILNVKKVNEKVKEAFEDTLMLDSINRSFTDADDIDDLDSFDSTEYLEKIKEHTSKKTYSQTHKTIKNIFDDDEDDDSNFDIHNLISVYEEFVKNDENDLYADEDIKEEHKRMLAYYKSQLNKK